MLLLACLCLTGASGGLCLIGASGGLCLIGASGGLCLIGASGGLCLTGAASDGLVDLPVSLQPSYLYPFSSTLTCTKEMS
jgi:hypothetical protein